MKHQPIVISVDDDPVYLRLMEIVLGSLPLELCTTTSPEVAVDLITVAKAGLLIVDLQMDEMSGEKLIRTVRETPNGKDLPILIISSNKVLSELITRVTPNSAYLPKPISPVQLHHTVEMVMSGIPVKEAVAGTPSLSSL